MPPALKEHAITHRTVQQLSHEKYKDYDSYCRKFSHKLKILPNALQISHLFLTMTIISILQVSLSHSIENNYKLCVIYPKLCKKGKQTSKSLIVKIKLQVRLIPKDYSLSNNTPNFQRKLSVHTKSQRKYSYYSQFLFKKEGRQMWLQLHT